MLRDSDTSINKCGIFSWDEKTCEGAAKNNNLEMMKWLRDPNARSDGSICEWNERTCLYASAYGSIELMEWLHKNECPWIIEECILFANQFNNVKMVEWLEQFI